MRYTDSWSCRPDLSENPNVDKKMREKNDDGKKTDRTENEKENLGQLLISERVNGIE